MLTPVRGPVRCDVATFAKEGAKMNLRAQIRRYPILSYFVLAYLISWGGSFAMGGPKFLRGEELGLVEILYMAPLVLAGPLVAGIVMAWLVDGRSGLRDLLSRVLVWRVGVR